MSVIRTQKTKCGAIHFERFETAAEVVATCDSREITDSSFDNEKTEKMSMSFEHVHSYDEALELMGTGYQPTVENLRGVLKTKVKGETGRFAFKNSIEGFAPIVPLALMGVPTSMVSMTMKPIKAKVVDVYYDITCSCSTSPEAILKAGQELLGAVVELERQGYRFNLYAVQTYSDSRGADMLVVKVKSATQPLDIKRVSFPLTHPAFFRVIGFDWYSKVPGGKYRGGYGRGLGYEYDREKISEMAKELFGKNAIYFSASKMLDEEKEHIKEVLTNGNSKA